MPLQTPKPYVHVRLIEDKERGDRYEVRVSHFVEFEEKPGRRAITGHPTKEDALKIAKQIAKAQRDQYPQVR